MPARCTNRTATSCAATAQTQLSTAQQALLAETEPMRIYSNPIITTPTATAGEASNTDLARILEQLSCQSQLMVDLLAAVNSLTAATLSLNSRG